MQKFGIDVSYAQKGINFNTVKAEGVEFAIIRGASRYSSNKKLFKDSQFENHYANAKNVGLPVGCYFYSLATNYSEGVEEANYLYNNCLKGKTFEYPIWLDVEDTKYMQPSGKDNITNAIKGFCETLENLGYYVGIYCNTNWANNYLNYNELKAKYDFWIAMWNSTCPNTNTYKYGMWQFGGETNKVRSNKISGYTVDQNYAYKDYPTIIKNAGLNGFPKPVVEQPKEEETTVPENPVEEKPGENDIPKNDENKPNTGTKEEEPTITPVEDETSTDKGQASNIIEILKTIIEFIINLFNKKGK